MKLTKELKCICMRNGIQIWKEAERLEGINFEGIKYIDIDGEKLNTADILGIFNAQTMEELTRRKNGEWQCKWNKWHSRYGDCGCASEERWEKSDRDTTELMN